MVERRSGSALPLLLAGVLACSIQFVAPARAEFGPPFQVSRTEPQLNNPDVAFAASGRALSVWQGEDSQNWRIRARARAADGSLGVIETLSAAGQDAESPQVAVDDNGDALVVWRRSNGTHFIVQARHVSASGVLGPVLDLSAAGQSAAGQQVAMDADGDALVVWSRSDGSKFRIEARFRSRAGLLSEVRLLSAEGQNAVQPQVAMTPDGRSIVVWHRFDGSRNRVQTVVRRPNGSFERVQTISGREANLFVGPQVAIDAEGDALIAWEAFVGSEVKPQARVRFSDGQLGPIATLAQVGQRVRTGLDADGDGLVVWFVPGEPSPSGQLTAILQGSAVTAAGAFGAVVDLSPTGGILDSPQLALDAAGNAVMTWHRTDTRPSRVEARRRSARGRLGPVQTLSRTNLAALFPQVALTPGGDAIAVWAVVPPAPAFSTQIMDAAVGP